MIDRTFIQGSEWLYFKIYTGTKTADTVLMQYLYPWVKKILDSKVIDKWFFIRYSDPDFHIRLRLHLCGVRNFNIVFTVFYNTINQLVDDGLIWNIQCDTYQRELERYGTNTIELIEEFFFADSDIIIHLLQNLKSENTEQQRWCLSLMLIDNFLSAFSFDMYQRKELLIAMAEDYKKEFGIAGHQMKKQLDDKFRTNRDMITHSIQRAKQSEIICSDGHLQLLKSRQQQILPIAKKITELEKAGALQVPIHSLLRNMIHMTINRWFRSKNRLHELVVYDFMSRYYTSQTAQYGTAEFDKKMA